MNGISGDALRAMIVRARWIVTVVFNFGGSVIRGGVVGRLRPAVVVRLASFAAISVGRIERRAAAALGGTGCAPKGIAWRYAGVLGFGIALAHGVILRLLAIPPRMHAAHET